MTDKLLLPKADNNMDDPIKDINTELSTGTTIMAVVYQDGVVIGADSRTTTGAYIANRVTDKLTPVHERIYCCRSGSAADTQAVADYVKLYLQMHATELGTLPLVKTAASLFQKLCYQNKNHLLAAILCAGWDPKEGGSVYSIPLGGSLVKQPYGVSGSGSTYIYGYCDAHFKENMTSDEAQSFILNALTLAMLRDGSSGGVCRLAVINKDGVARRTVPYPDLPQFYDKD